MCTSLSVCKPWQLKITQIFIFKFNRRISPCTGSSDLAKLWQGQQSAAHMVLGQSKYSKEPKTLSMFQFSNEWQKVVSLLFLGTLNYVNWKYIVMEKALYIKAFHNQD